jgi:Zn-dependent protease
MSRQKRLAIMIVLAILTFASFALLFGTTIGVALSCLVLLHELGHYVAMGKKGIRPSGIFMIPFLGAAVIGSLEGTSILSEYIIAIAGPLVGLSSSVLLVAIGVMFNNVLLLALAGINAYITLLNLIPAQPLDGGRAVAAIILGRDSKTVTYLKAIALTTSLIVCVAFGQFYLLGIALLCIATNNHGQEAIRLGKRIPISSRRQKVICSLVYLIAVAASSAIYFLFYVSPWLLH